MSGPVKRQLARSIRRGTAVVAANAAHSETWDQHNLLLGRGLSLQVQAIDTVDRLCDVEFKVFSQWGEDGIIEWLISHLPGIPERFVEIGVQDYFESNTRFLLMNRHWTGLVIDGSASDVSTIAARPDNWRYDLTAVEGFVTRDNVNALLAENAVSGDIGVFSLDIDGNDYWVLSALSEVRPWIVIVEYNAVLGDQLPLSIPYSANFARQSHVGGNLYCGAGIRAFAHWGETNGYVLVGSNRAGNNVFFVREEFTELLGKIAVKRGRPSRFREARRPDGSLSLCAGMDRLELLRGLPFVDVVSGETREVGSRPEMYSEAWV